MPIFNFNVNTSAPSSPAVCVESSGGSSDDTMPSTPSSIHSSPGAHRSSPGIDNYNDGESSPRSSGGGGGGGFNSRWNNRYGRRRGRGGATPRNQEKRPYHSPNHISPPHDRPMTKNDIYFALDCEMVGIGPEGLDSAVARVTICNWAEKVILDTYVKVDAEVTDYRTFVSGIEAKDLEGDDAMSLTDVQNLVKSILHGKILIGHALENDMTALQITHPWHDIRDSANYPPLMKESETDKTVLRPRKLKELAQDKLGMDIQCLGEAHDPIEDARTALGLYKSERMEWEKYIMKKVATAKVNKPSSALEGREGQPSGRGSPPNQIPVQQQQQLSNPPPPPNNGYPQPHPLPPPKQDLNYMYHRSRSAPTPHNHHGYRQQRRHHHQQQRQHLSSYDQAYYHQHHQQQHPPQQPQHYLY